MVFGRHTSKGTPLPHVQSALTLSSPRFGNLLSFADDQAFSASDPSAALEKDQRGDGGLTRRGASPPPTKDVNDRSTEHDETQPSTCPFKKRQV